jgi:ubiquinone/menaquinone biosynthesis C-methylase UbiE
MAETDAAEESLQQWRSVAPAWEANRERMFSDLRPVSEWLVEQLDPQPGQTVLEVAAGPGETGFLAAARLGPTGRLISSDFAPEMVAAARRGADQRGLENVECRELDAEQLDLPDASVDGVLSRFGLMLMPGQQRAVAEVRRVLRPGGRFAYATWGPPDRNPWLFQLVVALLQNGVTPPGDPFAPGGPFSLATRESNRALADAGGFADVTVEEITGVMLFKSRDEHWAHVTGLAGPVVELVASLEPAQIDAIRATLDPALAPYERDGALELPWTALGTRAA